MFWSTADVTDKNQVFYITPWDCDLAFGYRFGKNETTTLDAHHHRDHYENDYIDDFKLLKRYLRHDINGSIDLTVEKWETLSSAGDVLSLDSVLGRINKYRSYLEDTGAWEREMDRWPQSMNPDPDEEFQYMEDWLIGRYEWMESRLEDVKNGL